MHLVAHVISDVFPVEDDFRACEALQRGLPDGLSGNVVLAPRFATPSEAKTYIAGMDFFIGARMHSCIAAFSAGVPVVPMAYSRKFAGLFGALDYPYTVDCTTDNNDQVEADVLKSFERREVLESELKAALSLGLERLGHYEADLQRRLEQSTGRDVKH